MTFKNISNKRTGFTQSKSRKKDTAYLLWKCESGTKLGWVSPSPPCVTTGVKPERSGRQTSHRHDGVGVEVESAGQKEGGKTCYTVRHGEGRLKKR